MTRSPNLLETIAWATTPRLAATLFLAASAIACQGDGLGQLRSVTYPPDFHYITRQEIQTTMGSLAVEVDELETLMWQEGGPLPENQGEVVAILTRMQQLASDLKRRAHSNHPRIDRDGPRLRQDIERALAAARIRPPNYYQAGLVSGACTSCHEPRHPR